MFYLQERSACVFKPFSICGHIQLLFHPENDFQIAKSPFTGLKRLLLMVHLHLASFLMAGTFGMYLQQSLACGPLIDHKTQG